MNKNTNTSINSNENIEVKTFKGTDWKYAVVRINCHTDEGAMDKGWNFYDDTACDTTRIGRKGASNVLNKVFGEWKWSWIPQVVSCVEDEKWGKKHLLDMMEFRPHCCYKVEADALVITKEMENELTRRANNNRFVFWKLLNKFYKEAMGKDIRYVPSFIIEADKQERWEREVLGL